MDTTTHPSFQPASSNRIGVALAVASIIVGLLLLLAAATHERTAQQNSALAVSHEAFGTLGISP